MEAMQAPPANTRQIRMWAMFCHLAGVLFLTPIPFAHIIGPLVIWMLKREDHDYIDRHGREAVNFQISFTLYYFIFAAWGVIWFLIGAPKVFYLLIIPAMLLLWFFHLTLTLIGAVKANNGALIRYPCTMRFF